MEIANPFETDDTRAVSPVIGVILMVAITVILAAVIGAFVLDLGSQLGSAGPQSQLTVSDASGFANGSSDTDDKIVQIEHKGGDELKTSDLKVQVTLPNGTSFSTTDGDIAASWGSEFTVGETATISESGANLLGTNATALPAEVTVKVIHQPSNSVVASSKVEVQS